MITTRTARRSALPARRAWAASLAGLLWAAPCSGQIDMVAEAQRLRGTYPTGSIYLTYSALNDFTQHLANPDKVGAIRKFGVSEESIVRFRNYLDKAATENLEPGRATAFVQLDLAGLKAYTKKASDTDGASKDLAWSDQQVREIAILCDRLFNGTTKVARTVGEVRSGKIGVASAWRGLEQLRSDPFVADKSLVPLIEANRELQRKNPQEVAALATKERPLHQEITTFQKEFDSRREQKTSVKWIYEPRKFLLRDVTAALSTKDARDNDALSSYFAARKLKAPEVKRTEPTLLVPFDMHQAFELGRKGAP